jgi:hypothetical protein
MLTSPSINLRPHVPRKPNGHQSIATGAMTAGRLRVTVADVSIDVVYHHHRLPD